MSHTALLIPTPLRTLGAALKIVTPPASEPITVATAKAWVRRDDTVDDLTIATLITAARIQVEQDTHRQLMTQTWDLALDRLPATGAVDLLLAPVQSVGSVKTYDEDDVETTFASSNYYVDTYREPGRLLLNADASWPSDLRTHVAAVIRVTCGYAAGAPEWATLAIQLRLAALYEHRELGSAEQRLYDWLIGPNVVHFVGD